MEHEEKEIEEEAKQVIKMNLWIDKLSDRDTSLMLKQYAEHIRKQTIEECKEIIPKEKIAIFNRDTSWDMENANGFNECVKETLSALNELE